MCEPKSYRRGDLVNIFDKFLDDAMQSPDIEISIAPITRVWCGTHDNDGKFLAYRYFEGIGIDVKFGNSDTWRIFTPAAFK